MPDRFSIQERLAHATLVGALLAALRQGHALERGSARRPPARPQRGVFTFDDVPVPRVRLEGQVQDRLGDLVAAHVVRAGGGAEGIRASRATINGGRWSVTVRHKMFRSTSK